VERLLELPEIRQADAMPQASSSARLGQQRREEFQVEGADHEYVGPGSVSLPLG
jgi:hypothetical protein